MQRLPKGCSNVSHIIRSCFNTFLTMQQLRERTAFSQFFSFLTTVFKGCGMPLKSGIMKGKVIKLKLCGIATLESYIVSIIKDTNASPQS